MSEAPGGENGTAWEPAWAIHPGESLQEAEDEIGISDWIDPETGELLTDERPCAEINGKRVDAWTSWTLLARRPISEAEWNWLRAMAPLLPKSIPRKLRHSA